MAAENVNAESSGGWSETTGYYIDGVQGTTTTYESYNSTVPGFRSVRLFAPEASPTPDEHKGRRIYRILNDGGDAEFAAEGETLWYHKYHYTTAQMELGDGTVKTTSGRVWDWNATKATSPFYFPKLFQHVHARTYWGS